MKLSIDLREALRHEVGGRSVHVPATVEIDDIFEFEDVGDHEIDLDELLARDGRVALVFGREDVRARHPRLSDEQRREVVGVVHASFGTVIDDFIDDAVDENFPSARGRLDGRLAALKVDLSRDGSDDALALLTEMDGIRRVLGHLRDDDPAMIEMLAAAIDDVEAAMSKEG